MFQLHPQLAKDTFEIASPTHLRVLLMNDARYPWLILVPEKPDLVELHDLTVEDYGSVVAEIRRISILMKALFKADKMNVAALGNMVPQLHIHIIARFQSDPAWPAPVWGMGDAVPYDKAAANSRIDLIRNALAHS